MAITKGDGNLPDGSAGAGGTFLTMCRCGIRPQSFFQTNPTIASRLYATARIWQGQPPVRHMWDLRGFGLQFARRRRCN